MGTDRGAGLIVPLALQATVNGEAVDRSMIGLMRGKTTVHAVEQHANTYLMLRFNSDMRDVGWPEFDTGLRLMAAAPVGLQRLRATVLDLFCWAADCTDPKEFAAISPVMQEALRAALDNVLIVNALQGKTATIGKYQRIISQLDELAEFSPAASLGVDKLASRLGVSVRTLQVAVNAVHGVGPYQYLRSKRLWSARQQLITGASPLTIKAAAQANGFWHMSEFTRAYKNAFGAAI
jgi:AraC-like DNA-binding protein